MMPKKHEAEKENNERWLITYADLITLLLIFFIILYSMSKINEQKFVELSQSMAVVFGNVGRSGVLDGGRSIIPMEHSTFKQRQNITNTKEQIKRMIANMGLEGKITVRDEARGLVISVRDTVFFKPGSADLGARAQEIITTVASLLSNLPNSIRIEGHTDNIPIHTFRFFSNWELSTARATNVLHYLVKEKNIAPDRLSAAGYGEFKPIGDNTSETGRTSNRRVDIVVLDEEFGKFEPGNEEPDNIGTTGNNNDENPQYTPPASSIPDTVDDQEL
jgi:chemotaxis protein MotB